MRLKRQMAQIFVVIFTLTLLSLATQAQTSSPAGTKDNPVSKVWVADRGDGTYKNPIIHADYSDPDRGIYMVKAKNAAGPWSEPLLIKEAAGWEDPCPLWDTDGQAYLVSAMVASRSGIKSILVVSRMSSDGTKLLDDGVMVFDGHDRNPTVEGPKFYKRNGYYYIFAPAGGVETGWQL